MTPLTFLLEDYLPIMIMIVGFAVTPPILIWIYRKLT